MRAFGQEITIGQAIKIGLIEDNKESWGRIEAQGRE